MTESAGTFTVLCDDGTVWFTTYDQEHMGASGLVRLENYRWEQLQHGPIPGTGAATGEVGDDG